MSLDEIRIKENLKKLREDLEYIQENILASKADPIDKIKNMSNYALKIEIDNDFNQIRFLSRGLEFVSFERRIVTPIKEFLMKFGHSVLFDGTLENESKAEEMVGLAKLELIKIISEIKTNSYLF